jgi:hypothetical protein
LTACPNCSRELPEDALYCPECGTRTVGYSVIAPDLSPSHFNSGMTATSMPQSSPPPAPSQDDAGYSPPWTPPIEKRPTTRRRLIVLVIGLLAVLLVVSTFEAGLLGPISGPPSQVVHSASNPLTGEQLYSAYTSNETQATASYTNKTVYIQDSLDFGVGRDVLTGQYYSTVDSGTVYLYWSSQSQLSQLGQGTDVLAKCTVEGVGFSAGQGYVIGLQNCNLISIRSQASGVSVSANNE